ncbi:MAG: hypothetical protein ABIK09_21105 [Pseudomonadota bacterium]
MRVHRRMSGLLATTLVALFGLIAACTEVPLSRCDFQPQALCVGAPGCVPDCAGRECGPDPECGLSCGSCGAYSLCDDDAGQCEACDQEALCGERECGESGCGALCGVCGAGEACEDGACVTVCVPACKTRMCGDDGCGGTCGACPTDAACTPDGLCRYPEGHFCMPSPVGAPGCPGCPEGVEACVCALWPACCQESWSLNCVILSTDCASGCEPDSSCHGNSYGAGEQSYGVRPECGPDQYDRPCGACGPGERCHAGATCLPGAADAGLPCGADGDCLGGVCLPQDDGGICTLTCTNAGHCPEGWTCDGALLPDPWRGLCRPQEICFPACTASPGPEQVTTCGPDGCGGTCGTCPAGEACTPEGTCAPSTTDPCAVSWEAPGCAGCACEEAVCAAEPACCLEAWSPFCVFLCDAVSDTCDELMTCHPAVTPCDGCQVTGTPNCWNCPCQECVCATDPHCCLERWDDLCVMECQLCGTICPQ